MAAPMGNGPMGSSPAYSGSGALRPTPTSHGARPTSHEHEHYLRTFTDGEGHTVLIDEANSELAGVLVGQTGVDGIYHAGEGEAASGTGTWVDVHDGAKAIVDYAHPNYYTVYDAAGSPIATVSHSYERPTGSSVPPHYLMTFVNSAESATLLVDQAVSNAAILEMGVSGVDGIYTVPPGGFSADSDCSTGMQTWVDANDGLVAIIDNANPNLYTIYDASSSPVYTVSYN
ncbi:hypothetical protein H4R18_001809 [Coemansia javaensis]|uniref:Uncharacterized protein n=1 Tax=Coemansia javaensis TaxID=2761396 RepID=A0A9W8HJK6_9FUNG|nr:hypothetical protein H4R18_001809 [Coemansia javaensis]